MLPHQLFTAKHRPFAFFEYICSMRIVIQRVSQASVTINQQLKAQISKGLLVLLGITHNDTEADARWLAKKVATLRIFDDETGTMNRSVNDIDGEILLISQFTLMASCKKGNRPSWVHAADHATAIPLYERFIELLAQETGKQIATGTFGADMKVSLVNDGPVTICIDSQNKE